MSHTISPLLLLNQETHIIPDMLLVSLSSLALSATMATMLALQVVLIDGVLVQALKGGLTKSLRHPHVSQNVRVGHEHLTIRHASGSRHVLETTPPTHVLFNHRDEQPSGRREVYVGVLGHNVRHVVV